MRMGANQSSAAECVCVFLFASTQAGRTRRWRREARKEEKATDAFLPGVDENLFENHDKPDMIWTLAATNFDVLFTSRLNSARLSSGQR